MKTLKIKGRSVTVDIDKLAKGLCNMHCEDEDKKAVLAFGMLDSMLCDIMEQQLKEKIFGEFSQHIQILYEEELNKFSSDCHNEICKGVYSYAKGFMVV